MRKVIVHAGDFEPCACDFYWDKLVLVPKGQSTRDQRVWIHAKEIEVIDVATEESMKKVGGTTGWRAPSDLVFGPVGLLAGLLAGSRKKEVTFVARFRDGRKLLATTDNKTYAEILAVSNKV